MSISDILFGCEVREGSLTTLPALLKARFPYGNYLVLTDEESALALGKVLKKILKKLVLVIGEGEAFCLCLPRPTPSRVCSAREKP